MNKNVTVGFKQPKKEIKKTPLNFKLEQIYYYNGERFKVIELDDKKISLRSTEVGNREITMIIEHAQEGLFIG